MRKLPQKGFTLIELLVVVSLVIIVVGVTGDIVVSLVRSYNKTQITNEVEQNATFVITKMEKELRNAYVVDEIESDTITFRREISTGGIETVTYSIEDASGFPDSAADTFYIGRSIDGGAVVPITNYTFPSGVTVDPDSTTFEDISAEIGPKVIKINLSVRQVGDQLVQFTQATSLESTVIVRGSY